VLVRFVEIISFVVVNSVVLDSVLLVVNVVLTVGFGVAAGEARVNGIGPIFEKKIINFLDNLFI